MSTYAVRYTAPLWGKKGNDIVAFPVLGATVLVRRDGVATPVYANRDKAALSPPLATGQLPVGVAPGAVGLDVDGNLLFWVEPGAGIDYLVTVGGVPAAVPVPTLSGDFAESGGGTVPDADATTKGKIQLAGALGGTAAAPTVPGLAGKLAAVGDATKSGGTLTVDAAGSTTKTPLKVTSDPLTTVDHLTIVGPSRGVGAGEYRVIVDRNMGLQTNAAISVTTELWTGTNKEIPAILAQGRPYCIGVDSDIVGPTLYLKGNGNLAASHIEVQDHVTNRVFELIPPPGSGGLGAWLSIGADDPIATLTLDDKFEEPAGGAPTSFVMRHGRGTGAPASTRFRLPFTGDLDISANSEAGENSLSEWAIRFGHATQGISFVTAATPGGARTEMGRFVSTGLLLKAPAATSGSPDKTSPTLNFQDQYWNGSATVVRGFRVKDVALGGGPHALQFITDETSLVGMAIGYTGQVGIGDPFAVNLAVGQLHVVAAATTTPAIVADSASAPTADIQQWRIGSTEAFAIGPAGIPRWSAAGNQQTTVGAAGGASALPATPTKYLKVKDSAGATLVVPAYAA